MAPASTRIDAGPCGVDVSEVVAQRLPRDLGKRPGQLHAGWTTADEDEREQFLLPCRVRFALGALEGQENAPPDFEGILERLEARREPCPFGVAEVGVARPGCHDQRVVVERRPIRQLDTPGVHVDPRHLAKQHAQIARLA